MDSGGLERADALLADVAARVAAVLDARGQLLRLDADPSAWLDFEAADRRLVADLVRFAAAWAPPACELLLAATRPDGRLARVGPGRLVLRWQLALGPPPAAERDATVVPIRPAPDSADALIASREATGLVDAFGERGFSLAFEPLRETMELCATVRGPSRAP